MFDHVLIYAAVALGIAALATIAALASTFFMVQQRTTAVVQRFGKFVREAGPGLNTKVPFIDSSDSPFAGQPRQPQRANSQRHDRG